MHADQSILCYSLSDRTVHRHLMGFNDEITDAAFLSISGVDSHLALVTNSTSVRLYSLHTQNCQILSGHSDIILTVRIDASGRLLATGSKDNTARVWLHCSVSDEYKCISVLSGHWASVGALAFSRRSSDNKEQFIYTGSHDLTIKMWNLHDLQCSADFLQRSFFSIKAHERSINCLEVSPNNQFLASGSLDSTIKLFAISVKSGGRARELVYAGTCTGHKRSVWAIKFGKTGNILVSGSGDKTIKFWNTDDFTCIRVICRDFLPIL